MGSEVGYTKPLREYLNTFLKEHDVRSVVDYACGDQQWAKFVDWGGRTTWDWTSSPI